VLTNGTTLMHVIHYKLFNGTEDKNRRRITIIKLQNYPPLLKCYNLPMSHVSNELVPELYVTNFKKSLAFYTKILNFHIDYQRKEEGFAFLSLGKTQIMIDEIGQSRTWHTAKFEYPLGRGINFQIKVDNIESLYQKLQQHTIPIFLKLDEKWYRKNNKEVGSKQFLLQDPDGYLLRFSQDLGERELL